MKTVLTYMLSRASPRSWVLDAGHENSAFLQISGLRVKYVGPGENDTHAACVRTTEPALDAFFYFEVEVVNKGRDAFIGACFSAALRAQR